MKKRKTCKEGSKREVALLTVALVGWFSVAFAAEDNATAPAPATVPDVELPAQWAEMAPAPKVVNLAKRDHRKPAAPEGNIEDARRHYKEGRLDEAQAIAEKLVRENPGDRASRELIKEILADRRKAAAREQNAVQRDRVTEVRKAWLAPIEHAQSEEQSQAEQEAGNARKRWMEEKLQQRIPQIQFADAKLRDVIAYLSKLSGINILLGDDLTSAGEETVEEIEPGQNAAPSRGTHGGGDALASNVTIALTNVPLVEALNYILKPKGLKYRIDEYAIVIATPEKLEGGEMEARYYHLSSGIGTFLPIHKGSDSDKSLTIKDVLEQSGIPFPAGSKIYLDARTGTLIVRNTPANLADIEKVLGALDVAPFQVAIESKFVDITEDVAKELGLESFLTRDLPITFTRDPNLVVSSTAGSSSAGQYVSSTADKKGFTHGLRYLQTSAGAPRGNIFSLASVLTQPQLQVVLHALDQSGLANILSAPKVTTANNQQAKIEVVSEIFYPTQFAITPATTNDQGSIITPPVVIPGGFTSRNVGISLDVTPSVGSDKKTINLTLIPEVSTLAGWQDFGISVGSNFPAVPILQPVFTSKNVTASIVINDTETVVLGGLIKDETSTQDDKVPILGDIPFLGAPFRSKTETSTKKNLLIFVTAYLLSPEGDTLSGPYYKKTKIFNP